MTAEIIAWLRGIPDSLYLIMLPGLLKFCHHMNVFGIGLHFSLSSNFFLSLENCIYWRMQQLGLRDWLMHFSFLLLLSQNIMLRSHRDWGKSQETSQIGFCKILASADGLKLCGNCLSKDQKVWQKVFVGNIFHLFLQIYYLLFSTLELSWELAPMDCINRLPCPKIGKQTSLP